MSYKDEMPQDIRFMKEVTEEREIVPSWNERRMLQWDREIKLENGILAK